MMNLTENKIWMYFIGAILAAALGVGFILYALFGGGEKTPNTPQKRVYSAQIQSILTAPIAKSGDWRVLFESNSYYISYLADADTFAIDVLQAPAEENAKIAEQQFLTLLGIDQNYACTLDVSIKVPNSVDENLSGYDFGLSFCSGVNHISNYPAAQTQTQPLQ